MIIPALGVLALLAAIFVAGRWVLGRYDSLGRQKPFPWIGVGLLLLLGIGCVVPLLLRLRLESRLEAAATVITGARVEVHCQAFGEAFVDAGAELGYVPFGPDGVPERSTLIKRQQCRDLSNFIGVPTEITQEHVVAVHTLTHEAVHMSGVQSESETECRALQRDAAMAALLGAPPDAAQELATFYWETIYPRMPDGYRSDECRSGGTLDENLPNAPWEIAS